TFTVRASPPTYVPSIVEPFFRLIESANASAANTPVTAMIRRNMMTIPPDCNYIVQGSRRGETGFGLRLLRRPGEREIPDLHVHFLIGLLHHDILARRQRLHGPDLVETFLGLKAEYVHHRGLLVDQ